MKNFKKQSNLNNINLNEEEENKFTNLTPRRGSLPVDYNRPSPQSPRFSPKFPLTSPTTPRNLSPIRLNFNTFSPIDENFEEINDTLSELMSRGRRKSSDSLLNKLLDQKEKDIQRLESQNHQLLTEKSNWEKTSLKVNQLEKTLLNQNKKIDQLRTELKETETDLYQVGEEKDELNHLLSQEKLTNRKLEKRLEQQINENSWLRSSFNQTKAELLEKATELTRLKKLEKQEKEEWTKIFTEQEQKYELEKKEREEKFTQQINNLRTFQLTADIPSLPAGRGRGLHKKAYSLSLPSSRSASPRGSVHEREPDLFSELSKTNYFNPCLTSSPLKNDDINPLEEVQPDTSDTSNFDFSQFEDLLNEVDNFTNETSQEQENNQGLIEENNSLKENQTQLENEVSATQNAYKTLFDEKVEQERLLQDFTQKEANWGIEKQTLNEELAELKYKLAEANSKVERVEKEAQKTRQQLKLKEQENEELTKINKEYGEYFASLEIETDELENALQENQAVFTQLEAKIETSIKYKP